MGRAVAVVVVAVVVAAFGSEEQGGQNEQTTSRHQHGGEGEPGGFHGATGWSCLSSLWRRNGSLVGERHQGLPFIPTPQPTIDGVWGPGRWVWAGPDWV